MLSNTQEPTGADNGVGDGLVRRDDDVVHLPYLLVLVVVDGLSQDLPLRVMLDANVAGYLGSGPICAMPL